jgi:hypothetical protein
MFTVNIVLKDKQIGQWKDYLFEYRAGLVDLGWHPGPGKVKTGFGSIHHYHNYGLSC